MKKWNKILKISDILIVTALLISGIFLTKKSLTQKGSVVFVEANGKKYEYSLSRNGTYSVQGAAGETVFAVTDGKVRILESACPNKNCVQQGWTSPIVCLPNKVIITIEDYGEFDAVSE